MQLKILSWNIWMAGDFNFRLITQFLRSSNADIIGLQEVIPECKGQDVVGFLTGLDYHHVFSTTLELRTDGVRQANAIFSKYPIQASKTHVLSEEERRVAVEADIPVGNTVLSVFSVHTLHTHQKESELLTRQVDRLIQVLPKEKAIVLGDFNATPEMTPIKRIRKVLVDTAPFSQPTWSLSEEGCSVCKPKALDTRLDYIFVSKDIAWSSFKVEDAKGSDHLPISVIVKI